MKYTGYWGMNRAIAHGWSVSDIARSWDAMSPLDTVETVVRCSEQYPPDLFGAVLTKLYNNHCDYIVKNPLRKDPRYGVTICWENIFATTTLLDFAVYT